MTSAIQVGIIVNCLTVQNKDYMASRKGMVIAGPLIVPESIRR